ncbi:RecX family transcriptional regulator [Aneurinibacillus sp. Ricciae_BoGa-3]|uniref:RecX family transcriptional regulator n=1 Tax=Aneurinibacillus sp. Ricciae_BoGa-3 TaxID=3022697 RepID=UPI0023418225|nr:RecX family transcriptional regulator [Aneurinibacillus sp. Ricciae_BoGa-3]WCK56147.1 RecX family transcriptional regulator [Aneurinibacillus sp. Ricciae_BoGa-3]
MERDEREKWSEGQIQEVPAPGMITKLERQKRNRERVNVYIDDSYAFAIHEDVLVKYRLIKGRQIDKEEMQGILEAEEKNRAEHYALRYIGFRPRTVHEVQVYLLGKGFPEEAAEEVVQRCLKQGYLDDRRYAEQWVEERMRLKPRGRHLLRQELRNRGIDENTIEHAVEGLAHDTELEACLEAARKKYSKVRFATYAEMRNKVGPFLQRKGFGLEIINRVLEILKSELCQR